MNLVQRKSNLPLPQSPIVSIAIVIGTREDVEAVGAGLIVQIRRKHFFPRRGWELKDVVIVGLPQKFRFCVIRDMEIRETVETGLVILFCSKG